MTTTLFADDPPPIPVKNKKDIFRDGELLVWAGVLAGALLVAAVVIYFFDRRRKRGEADGGGMSATLQLTDYREMYENGEITLGEYERIRNKLAAKMKKEVGLKAVGGAGEITPDGPPASPTDPPPAVG